MEVCVLTPADLDRFSHLYPPELPGFQRETDLEV